MHPEDALEAPEKVTSLDIDHGEMDVVRRRLKEFKNVDTLNLVDADIARVPPEVAGLKALESVSVASYGGRLPAGIEVLAQVKKLVITGEPDRRGRPKPAKLGELPDALSKFTRLENLLIKQAAFEDFPAVVWKLPALEYLSVSLGSVKRFPPGIAGMKRLRSLDLDHLTGGAPLPPDLGKLATLESLQVETVPLSGFAIEKGDYKQLAKLTLASCELSTIPEAVAGLPLLRFLHVSGNPLVALPEALAKAKGLKRIYAENCRLERIPAAFFSLPELRGINLTGNTFPANEAKALAQLAKRHPKIEVEMPRVAGAAATPKAVSTAPLSAAIVKELDRLGLTAGKARPNPFEPRGAPIPPPPRAREVKIAGVVWPVPPATAEIFERFWGAILAPFLDEKERQPIDLGWDRSALAEYECIQHAPYVLVAMTKTYFFLLLRLDDEKPNDPTLYVLDHEDFQEHEARSLSSLIAWLKAAQPAPEKDATG